MSEAGRASSDSGRQTDSPAPEPSPAFYEETYRTFRWNVPPVFNIGADVCDRWAATDPDRVAIIEVESDAAREFSYLALKRRSNRIANLLRSLGVEPGDRVGVLASQRFDTAAIHIAIYKLGAIAVPLFALFGRDALRHRLADSGARSIFVDKTSLARIDELREDLPALEDVICLDESVNLPGLESRIGGFSEEFEFADTLAESPALIIYTSGTTGPSKGAVLPHQALLGHLPGVEMSHNGLPMPGDRIWTPADWAWIGGLMDVLLPALHHGVPVVACRFEKFEATRAFDLIEKYRIRNLFLPATALKLMREIDKVEDRWTLDIRSVASGGEPLGSELLAWGRRALGVTINEFYGQTECNMVVSSCSRWFDVVPGAIGRTVPGHVVRIVDDDGQPVACGEQGHIAIQRPDPVMFLGYWNQPEATAEKFRGEWLLTGDLGTCDAEGFIHFIGRSDDVITSAGYRIGPSDIEDCLLSHPSVAAAGVVGVPDERRTEAVAAFIVLRSGAHDQASLATELQDLVRRTLGAHQYPRIVRFVDQLPSTPTGKLIRRELRYHPSL